MAYPDSLSVEVSTAVAEELLILLSDEAVSDELRMFLGHLRGDVKEARAQGSMFQ